MPARNPQPHRNVWLLLLFAAAAVLAIWLWLPVPSVEVGMRRPAPGASPPTRDAGAAAAPRSPMHAQRSSPPGCRPKARAACRDGNVWWFDGCDNPGEQAESCEGRGCADARCTPDTRTRDHCGDIDDYGRCAGDVATACVAGELVHVDCAAEHARCVMTGEGAECLPRDDKRACSPGEPAQCRGTHLRQCIDGRFVEMDCAARLAVCDDSAGAARCLALGPLPKPSPPLEVCDGRDNDDDGRVDEGDVCGSVPLVAFVPHGAQLDSLDARMQNELAILNRIHEPLHFHWGKLVEVPDSYRTFDPRQLETLAQSLSLALSNPELAQLPASELPGARENPTGFDFYIAVLYTEKLLLDPPKSGMSTLPNARCGGVRLGDAPSPPGGLIVLSEARRPETLAHEMGHYLGLCHTHETLERHATASTSAQSVADACRLSGDGICDTPIDPGPAECPRSEPCDPICHVPARPDASNVMSYYMGCRRSLTAEQSAETARNLSLRRGWFPCLDARNCPCLPTAASTCPPEMSCHPGEHRESSWLCELDGAALPGAPCRGSYDCSQGSFCLTQGSGPAASSCTRACAPGEQAGCVEVGLAFRVRAQDLLR